MNRLNYAGTQEEAQSRFVQHRNEDPFPDIKPALLNTADIADYVHLTGMIYPFDPEKLKPASYEMNIGGEVLCWDDKDKEKHFYPRNGTPILISKNSITFVTVNAKFRLPDYIAMRFNLQIEHVHKGILLGTGPLINPGFVGRLMIPLHNLTNNDYYIKCGSSLIGVELTKLSNNGSWRKNTHDIQPQGEYKENTKVKSDKTFHDYIAMFVPRGCIVKSSLSGTLDKANRSAIKAEKIIKRISGLGSLVALGVFIGLVTLFFQTHDMVSSANSYVASSNERLIKLEKENERLKSNLESQIQILSEDLTKLSQEKDLPPD